MAVNPNTPAGAIEGEAKGSVFSDGVPGGLAQDSARQGPQGPTGPEGPPGMDGAPGIDGGPGPTGPHINDIDVSKVGDTVTLTFNFTDPTLQSPVTTTFNVADGAPGESIDGIRFINPIDMGTFTRYSIEIDLDDSTTLDAGTVDIPHGQDGAPGTSVASVEVGGIPDTVNRETDVTLAFRDQDGQIISVSGTFSVPWGDEGEPGDDLTGISFVQNATQPDGSIQYDVFLELENVLQPNPATSFIAPIGTDGSDGRGISDVSGDIVGDVVTLTFDFDSGTPTRDVSFTLPAGSAFTGATTDTTINGDGLNTPLSVANPFTAADQARLQSDTSIVSIVLSSTDPAEGTTTYTAERYNGTTISWTTGGGGSPTPGPEVRFPITLSVNSFERSGISTDNVNVVVSIGAEGDNIVYTGFQGVSAQHSNGTNYTVVPTEGTSPTAAFTVTIPENAPVGTVSIRGEILYTNDGVNEMHTFDETVTIRAHVHNIFYLFSTNELDAISLSAMVDTGVEAAVGNSFNVPENPGGLAFLYLAYPDGLGNVVFHNNFGSITPDETLTNITDDIGETVTYDAQQINNAVGPLYLTLEV